MILFPPAKINLGLNILGKRPDGFHEIETCMYPINWTDVLELIPEDDFDFEQSGIIVDCAIEDNLCVKAFRLMQKIYSAPNVFMHLRKNIPMGAGLGGGSADAAYVLKGLNELFSLNLTSEKMKELASELGSDCPFFIDSVAQMAKGRGEHLSPLEIELGAFYIKIVYPGIHVSTKDAYAGVRFSELQIPLEGLIRQPIESWKHTLENSFESTVFTVNPGLEELKTKLYEEGAIYASMSGSGSSLYGIFTEQPIKSNNSMSEWIGRL